MADYDYLYDAQGSVYREVRDKADESLNLMQDHLNDFAAEACHRARTAFAQTDVTNLAYNLLNDLVENYDGEWPDEDRIITAAREYVADL